MTLARREGNSNCLLLPGVHDTNEVERRSHRESNVLQKEHMPFGDLCFICFLLLFVFLFFFLCIIFFICHCPQGRCCEMYSFVIFIVTLLWSAPKMFPHNCGPLSLSEEGMVGCSLTSRCNKDFRKRRLWFVTDPCGPPHSCVVVCLEKSFCCLFQVTFR